MKIFTDLHHGDLYFSLHLLFERRLNFELYRPIGYDWYHEGYWKIGDPYPTPLNTAKQYLDINDKKWDPYNNLNDINHMDRDVYMVKEPAHDYFQKAITLETFKSMKFDVILPSFPTHDAVYEKLRNKYQPQAKLVMQMGNAGQRTHLPNVLHSSPFTSPSNQHCLRYHQEINPDLFYYSDPSSTRNIYSVVNCAPFLSHYTQMKSLIKDANWKYYGATSPDGALPGSKGVAAKMHEANVAWHLKPGGGVGHSTKGWFAVGRPLVTNMNQHKRAGGDTLRLFRPGVTCIDLDSGSIHENEKKIRRILEPEENFIWSKRVRKIFDEVVNYDEQEQKVRKFLENLR